MGLMVKTREGDGGVGRGKGGGGGELNYKAVEP